MIFAVLIISVFCVLCVSVTFVISCDFGDVFVILVISVISCYFAISVISSDFW